MMTMTFHENFGTLPKPLLTLYRKHKITPSEHDQILAYMDMMGETDNWSVAIDFVNAHVDEAGIFRISKYL